MRRLFDEHKKRKVIDLNGKWKFKLDPKNIGREEGWQNRWENDGETVIVPSCWNNELRLLNYEGNAWYQREFEITEDDENPDLLFNFDSVMTNADVWVDGTFMCNHYGAFTGFSFITSVEPGMHTLTVRVDNIFDTYSFPQRYTDWFNYGGIARDVYFSKLYGISILDNHIVYTLSDDFKSVKVHAELELYNKCDCEASSILNVTIGENEIYIGEISLAAKERKIFSTPEVTIDNIELWDTSSPKLYTVVAKTETDDLIDRVGFRKIEVNGNDIILNGKSIELLGVNRHEEHPDWGFAFPSKLMKKDLDLILDMNCNTIRGSHYPNSKIFVDMLDEKGILFWSEIPMWGVGFSWESLADPVIINRGLNMHKEMTKQYYNHPCIIIWGMHNEIDTTKETSLVITKEFYEHLRKHGGNRLITHASNHPLYDLCMDYDDIICLNVYYGWYKGGLDVWDKFVVDFKNRLVEKNWFGKPVIMSEFGAAALAGFHSHFDTVRWSEEYQRDLLEYTIELFHKTEYMRGTYVWQFCNIRTSPSMDINRVRYFNNKGIIDENRNPKAAFFKVKELYGKYAEQHQTK